MEDVRDLEVMGEVRDLVAETDKLIWRSNRGVVAHQDSSKETVLREAKIEIDHHRVRIEMGHHRIRIQMGHQGIKIETDHKADLN